MKNRTGLGGQVLLNTASTGDSSLEDDLGRSTTSASPTTKLYLIWVVVVTASAFGPYVLGSIRTEQAAVYLSLPLALLLMITSGKSPRFSPQPWAVIGLLAILLGTAAISATQEREFSILGEGSLLAGYDNLSLPIVVILVAWQWRRVLRRIEILRATAIVTVIFMTTNVLLTIGQWQGFISDEFLGRFWVNQGDFGLSSYLGAGAESAASGSRYLGLFNQPAEAGIAYSIALVMCIWLWLDQAERGRVARTIALGFCSVFLIIGGTLTISKIFLLAAPLSAITFAIVAVRRRQLISLLSISLVGVFSAMFYLSSSTWEGTDVVGYYFGGGFLSGEVLSGGRYGTDSTLAPTWEFLWETRPVFGLGAGGIAGAYDSLWISAMVYAGLVGVICTIALFVVLLSRWVRSSKYLASGDRGLSAALLTIALGASLGIPSIIANRVATLWWIPISVLLVCGTRTPAQRVAIAARSRSGSGTGADKLQSR